MAPRRLFVVFVLPVILSIGVASAAMADILDRPGRELVMWPPQTGGGHGATGPDYNADDIRVIGLADAYAVGEPITIRVVVDDPSFDCGDLYITIYDKDQAVLSQKAFFSQCFAADGDDLPIKDEFSAVIDSSGSFMLVADMQINADVISAVGEFIVE